MQIMRKLFFIIVLFFSTSVLAIEKWEKIPGLTIADLLYEDLKIIDTFTQDGKRAYLFQKIPKEPKDPVILCFIGTPPPQRTPVTTCYWEEKYSFGDED